MATASELSIDSTATALDMANTMFGESATIISATFTGDSRSSGIYSGGLTTSPGAVPSDSGVILSTGFVEDFTNSSGETNTRTNTSSNTTGVNGDPGLDGIAGVSTYDAAIFEAEFIPTGNTLSMQLVFASEEYREWINTGFNDVVGIWINDVRVSMSIGDGQISIDNINHEENANLFIDNTDGAMNTEMDGLTKILTIKAPVNIGETNTVRFGIADAGDVFYDSNLVIVADSVQSAVIAGDDEVELTVNTTQQVNLLENDAISGGQGRLTHINGAAVSQGDQVTLATGEVVTLLSADTVRILAGSASATSTFTYTVQGDDGQADTGFVTLTTTQEDVIFPAPPLPPADTITGTNGHDQLIGSAGREDIRGFAGNDIIYAGAGNDSIYGGSGRDEIWAGTGDDLLGGNSGDDLLGALAGDDTLFGDQGDDSLYAGDGDDNADGGDGDDIIWGGTGNDTLRGGDGRDMLGGAEGDDLLIAGDGNSGDTLWAGDGDDTLEGSTGRDELWAGTGNNMLYGYGGNDTMGATNGNDYFHAGWGEDTVYASGGQDHLIGGNGNDELWTGAGDDRAFGGNGNDTIDGALGDDLLLGEAGDDLFFGYTGNDTIDGGTGNDVIYGGAGLDNFLFRAGDGEDTLGGFSLAEDTLIFEGLSLQDLTFTRDGNGTRIDYGSDSLFLTYITTTDPNAFDILFQ